MNRNRSAFGVAVIILNWNGLEDTRECLLSLQKIDYPRYTVIVVDNGSSGDDVECLKEQFGEYIDIVVNESNLGYAKGVNIGVKTAREKYAPDYYLLLNNDTIVDAGFLSELVESFESNGMAGIVGPKVYYYDAPQVLQSLGANINMYTGTASYPGLKQKDVGQYDKISEVDWVGPCTLIKAEVFNKIGYFDEGYFAYWEDV
ncbi:MAG: glycosyltransferase family 2 protein, partial [Dehalococcoidia bacterium]